MTIEKRFDIPFIASLALREKQIQQNYRPIIAVHKWFARRPGTLFRGLLLAEFSDVAVKDAFYRSNDLKNLRIADPFMGGGTPLIEANRLGCDVVGYDINPMSWWIVSRELEHLDLHAYVDSAAAVSHYLEQRIADLYQTQCGKCGNPAADVKYFLWVKTVDCLGCGEGIDLFPGYLLAEDVRHPRNVFVCPQCGELTEAESRTAPGKCGFCKASLRVAGPAKRSRCNCSRCGIVNTYPRPAGGALKHRMFAIEYHCAKCKGSHKGRFFKKPSSDDLARHGKAERLLSEMSLSHVPDDEIPAGDETTRLHRWGYRRYRELFNNRQLLGLELLARKIEETGDGRVRNALATNLSDLLRYQNMLCRYDTMALKSLDIFSVHGYPVGLVQCEPNFIGIVNGGGVNVGSGGWANIVEKFRKAKAYCDAPFEIRHSGGRKTQVFIRGEWIGDTRNGERRCANRTTDARRLRISPRRASMQAWPIPPCFVTV